MIQRESYHLVGPITGFKRCQRECLETYDAELDLTTVKCPECLRRVAIALQRSYRELHNLVSDVYKITAQVMKDYE